MKKIIAILVSVLCLFTTFRYRIYSVGDFNVIITNNVEGYIGTTITSQTVELTFDDINCKFIETNLPQNMDITSWFSFPTGCNYTVKVNDCAPEKLTVTFDGDIEYSATVGETPITVTIPYTPDDPATTAIDEEVCFVKYDVNNYKSPIDDVINTNAKYIIKDDFNIQYDGPYTVSGIVGESLTPQIVRVEITAGSDEFSPNIENVTLPVVNGLTPTVTEVDPDCAYIVITYTGTPINPSQDLIHTTILKENMLLEVKDRVVPDRVDVKFDIVAKNIPTPPSNPEPSEDITYTIPVTGID